ncbi:hypothetical protein IPG41_01925 [Candidatus Peregrinibacteria bacterium]|nr:MAG: hypothetical protein IPG41_01925 [Candidatus Peregrinibacteria bacterium]
MLIIAIFILFASCSKEAPIHGNSIAQDKDIKIFSTSDYSLVHPLQTSTLFEGNTFKVTNTCEDSTCTIQFLDKDGDPMICPEEVHCSYPLDGSYHMNEKISSVNEDFFVYGVHDGLPKGVDHDMASIKLYSRYTDEVSTLVTFSKETRASIGNWSPDYDQLVITAINDNVTAAFPHSTLIYVLNFQDSHFVSVDPYDIEAIEPYYNVGFSAQWIDEDTLSYIGPSTDSDYFSTFALHLDTGKIEYLSSSKLGAN